MEYNRIFIVGGPGSGKTTLAKKLSKIINTKYYELDDIAYKKRSTYEKRDERERDKKIKSIIKRKKWVVEGFYSRPWIYPLYKKSDVVLILNIKPSTLKRRIILRFIKRKLLFKKTKKHNKQVKEIIPLLKRIDKYPTKQFRLQKRASKRFNKNVLILNNQKEINNFLKT